MAGLGPAQKERTGLLPMNSLRYLMQALAVVIVMIAAVALPSGAYAHAGHAHGQQVSAALAGQLTVDAALEAAQTQVERDMTRAGYIK